MKKVNEFLKKTTKRFLIWLATVLLESIASLIFQNKLKSMNNFIQNHFPELLITVLVFSTAILIAIWFVFWLIDSIKYLNVKTKYYDIMINKMNTEHSSHVFLNDLRFFTAKEKKYIDSYLINRENLKIFQKGTSTTFGEFK